MERPILFIARSWHGHGGMQRLNRDVVQHVGGSRSSFVCIHPQNRSIGSFLSFCFRALLQSVHLRGSDARIHLADAAALPLGIVCAWIGGTKLSVTACGLDVVYPRFWYQWMIRFCLRFPDHVICISHATAEVAHKRGVPADRITVIPCGIDPPDRQLSVRDPYLLLTVGRVVRRKGVAWFVEHVFPKMLEEQPDLRYIIIGDGPERLRILRLIDRLHVGYAVKLLAHVPDDARDAALRAASVFVVPNIAVAGDMEGFGIVCLEAASRGLQVAAARIDGLTDAVMDGETGRFFVSGDAEDCARVIRQMIARPLADADVTRVVIDRFAWSTLVPLYNNVWNA
jgi:phosphatidyl-myo-inositol dimannoside synthase